MGDCDEKEAAVIHTDALGLLIIAWIVAAWLGAAFMAGYLAEEKGYNGLWWVFFGLFLGLLALVAAAGLPDRSVADVEDASTNNPKGAGTTSSTEVER